MYLRRKHIVFPVNPIPVSLVQLKNKYERAWLVLKITSLGFSDIGFSPWASRTWPEIKGEKTCKRSKGIKKQICFPAGPCNLSLLQAKCSFPAALSKLLLYNHGKVIMTLYYDLTYLASAHPLLGDHILPSPISPRARWERGARSPLAPTVPFSGTKERQEAAGNE